MSTRVTWGSAAKGALVRYRYACCISCTAQSNSADTSCAIPSYAGSPLANAASPAAAGPGSPGRSADDPRVIASERPHKTAQKAARRADKGP